ncbi:ESX secretion-associated protein EspG [Qaidamihabitans albus]|uniref:ESX secretion-associated protein EspG n=1 Tax=Qaidamihabitans albus TaxID=2795733 RepID=UPI0018F227AC|nr:ESX secretion-associated protein EspG [Qaidamihabitans albus]
MAWRDDVTLHRVSVLRSLEEHRIGEPPEVLAGDDVWLPPESRARLDDAVAEDLAGQRLLTGGRPREDFYDALVLLTRPGVELFGWVQDDELGNYAVSVSRTGRDCVLLLRRGDWVRLMPADPDGMAETWIEQIPHRPAGGDTSLNLPESDAPWILDHPRTPDGRKLKRLLELPRFGGGQIHAAIRSANGRQRAATPLTYLDTADGRWLLGFDTSGPDRWVTATPATQHAFETKLRDLPTNGGR